MRCVRLQVASASSVVLTYVPHIADVLVGVFAESGEEASVVCARSIVDTLSPTAGSDPHIFRFLQGLLNQLVQIFITKIQILAIEPDSMSQMFAFVYSYQLQCPRLLVSCEAMPSLPQVYYKFFNRLFVLLLRISPSLSLFPYSLFICLII